jgi:hypothetical protein
MEIMLADILKSYSLITETSFYDKMTTYFSNYDSEQDYNQPLHILLDIIRLGDLFLACGITLKENVLETKKPILNIATMIAKSDFSPATYAFFVKTVAQPIMEGGNKFYRDIYNTQEVLNEKQMIQQMASLGITMYGKSQSLRIKSKVVLMNLQKNFIVEKIKKDLYNNENINSNMTITTLIENEMIANNIHITTSSPVVRNLNENGLISSLNKYQHAIHTKELIKSPSKTKKKSPKSPMKPTRKKRRRPTTPDDDEDEDEMSYENKTPPENTYNTPTSSPQANKKK